MWTKLFAIFAVIFLIASPALAVFCAHDDAPAASLLFPFVYFDYTDTFDPATTELTITNVSSEAQILQVTIWTDFGEPFLSFHVLLTGYDVQRINLADVLADGRIPGTVWSSHTTFEGSADDGPVSSGSILNGEWLEDVLPMPLPTNSLGERCASNMPWYPGQYSYYPIPGSLLDHFETLVTMSQRVNFLASDACDGSFSGAYQWDTQGREPWFNTRDRYELTWMYITVDVVETCHMLFPTVADYWVPHTDGGQARYDNVLIGDIMWISGSSAAAGKAVHIEADRQLASVVPKTESGQPISFYHRYSSNQGVASDAREPLPTAWAFPYVNSGFNGDKNSQIRVWKGSTNFSKPVDFHTDEDQSSSDIFFSNCLAYTYYAWDEDENVVHSTTLPGPGGGSNQWVVPNLLPLAVQEVDVSQFNIPDERGWLLFVWPPSNYGQDGAPETPDAYQVWMGVAHDVWGRRSRFAPATPMANANCYPDQILPDLGVDYDYVDGFGNRVGQSTVIGPATVD